ncbi:MAG: nuclear transport factor 2 family protein [Actinomycetota bacterium]
MERFFTAGEAQVELVQSYASGDLAVLVVLKHQHATVGGLPDQPWSLRVTLVFRRDDGDWKLVHRHADPLVARHTLEQIAELARG